LVALPFDARPLKHLALAAQVSPLDMAAVTHDPFDFGTTAVATPDLAHDVVVVAGLQAAALDDLRLEVHH